MGPVAAAQIGACGEALAADRHDVWAARMEAAAAGRINEARRLATRKSYQELLRIRHSRLS